MIKGIKPALAEGGKIKIGGLGDPRTDRRGSPYRLPVKYDHFVVTSNRRSAAGDLEIDEPMMSELPKDSDGEVREIPIVVHSDEIDEVFPTTYALYSGKKLACRGDGEFATRWEMKDGRRTGRTKECECTCPLYDEGKCKPHGILHCSIAIPGRAIAGAVHKWRTTSIISIQRIIGSLHQIKETCGSLRGLPLTLKLEPVHVTPDNAPATTVYVCHVELRAKDVLEVQRLALDLVHMRARVARVSGLKYGDLIELPAADNEPDDEQAVIAAEFHSDDESNRFAFEVDAPVKSRRVAESDLAIPDAGLDETEGHRG